MCMLKETICKTIVLGYVGHASLAHANQEIRMVTWVKVHSMLVVYPTDLSSIVFRTRLIHNCLYFHF